MLKRKCKNAILTMIIFVAFSSSLTVSAKEIKKETTDKNKAWNIKFTQDIDFNDETKKNITLVDSKGNTIITNIRLGDSKTVIVDSPKEGYKEGETYILNISNKVHSTKNKYLKDNVDFNFTITKSQDSNNGEDIYKDKVDSALKKGIYKILQEEKKDDWQALAIARHGEQIPESYLRNLESNLDLNKGIMGQPTDYERTTLALTAIGKNPTNFKGYNIVEKIYNSDQMENQGINAYIFALIALDSGKFTVPNDAIWTRKKLINKILDNRTEDKGWSYGGDTADSDMIGMAITALAPYKDRADVASAIKEAVDKISLMQNEDGGFSSWETENSESSSQVIIGLCTNGIDPTESKFIKNGKNPIDALLNFQIVDGGFYHTKDTGYNGMATEQAVQALEAYKMFKEGKGGIYIFR